MRDEHGIVILSTVRSQPIEDIDNPEHVQADRRWCLENLGFVSDEHQINVGITRSKYGLVIVGNMKLLNYDNTWKDLLNHYKEKKCIVSAETFPKLEDLKRLPKTACTDITHQDAQFPGIDFIGRPRKERVTSEGVEISWKDIGIEFVIPPGAVPEDKPLELTVRPCLSGPFIPPTGSELASPVYMISPAFDFLKEVEVLIYHFSSVQSNEDSGSMTFVSTPSFPNSEGTDPQYRFKDVKSGVFWRNEPYGLIRLRHFCGLAVSRRHRKHPSVQSDTPKPKRSRGSQQYSIRMYTCPHHNDSGSCYIAIFCIVPYQPLYVNHLERYLKQWEPELLKKMPIIEEPMRFSDNKATLVLPDPSKTPGFHIVPDSGLEIYKEQVDIALTSTPLVESYPKKIRLSFIRDINATVNPGDTICQLSVSGFERPLPLRLILPVQGPVVHHHSSTVSGSAQSSDMLGEGDLMEITEYLHTLVDKRDIYSLGLVLGLHHERLKAIEQNSSSYLDDVIAAWLRKEGDMEKRGGPCWSTLVKALQHQRLKQLGIAKDIADSKGLQILLEQ